METVNNLASAASRAIWGDGDGANAAQTNGDAKGNETRGQEPLSGETGNVEAGEPYDKGNAGGEFASLALPRWKQELIIRRVSCHDYLFERSHLSEFGTLC
jgi:hypothetical protein